MSDKPRPLWMIGRENFEHGAAARKQRLEYLEKKSNKQDSLENQLNLDPKKAKQKAWSKEELQELWFLRYERKPKATYDQLATRYGGLDTQVIVDALVMMRQRKECGLDPFKAYGHNDAYIKPSTKPLPEQKPVKTNHVDSKTSERTRQMVVCRGMGMTLKEIADQFGVHRNTASSCMTKFKKKYPGIYSDLIRKGQKAKK